MAPLLDGLSNDDLAYLEDLAEVDTIDDASASPSNDSEEEFGLDTDEDDLFDSFIVPDEAMRGTENETQRPTTPKELYPVLDVPSSQLLSSPLSIRLKSGRNLALAVKSETTKRDTNVPSTPQNIKPGIKRAASAWELRSSQEGEKPAKLNKSFSGEVRDSLSGLQIQTQTHPSGVIATETLSLSSSQLSAELAIERELGSIRYQIPLKTLIQERQKNVGKSKPVAFWSHLLYQDVEGNRVKVEYCKTKEQSERTAASLLNEKVLGFDMEWLSTSKQSPNLTGLKREVCTIQVASEDRIAVFHVALHAGDTVDDLIVPSLKQIIESDKIIKTGNSIWRADGTRLKRHFKLRPRSLVELSQLHEVVRNANRGPNCVENKPYSLAYLVNRHFELPMFKGNTRTSDWGKALDAKQILYAAADAYAGYMLYRVLDGKRMSQSPIPPRPAFAELRIRLSDQIKAWYDERGPAEQSSSEDSEEESGQPDQEQSGLLPDAEEKAETPVEKAPKKKVEKIALNAKETKVFEALCAHRLILAKSQNIKAFVIAGNNVLRNMAVQRPTNITALQAVPGIGWHRAKTYGDDWLRIIQEHDHLWMAPHMSLPNDFAQREVVTYNRLLSALQSLRSGLAQHQQPIQGEMKASLPTDDDLERLARIKPMSSAALRCIPGAESFCSMASFCNVDLLLYINQQIQGTSKDEIQIKTPTKPSDQIQGTSKDERRIKTLPIPNDQDGSDSDYFENMDVSRISRRT